MLKIINPANHKLIEEIPEDSSEKIREKFERAVSAQKGWASVPLLEKLKAMKKFGELLTRDRSELAKTLSQEMGKPIAQSNNEVQAVLKRIDFFVAQVPRVLDGQTICEENEGKLKERISWDPLGVIGNISAWNYPYFVGSNVFVPALLGGNAVLYKPSEFATLTGIAIGKLLHEAGVPTDVFSVILGGADAGRALLENPIQGIFFTGSYATGKSIAETMAGRMIRTQLELGGKDPIYICEDTPIEFAAASMAEGVFYNTGQSCCAVERVYVHEQSYSRFLEAFVEEVKKFVIGDPLDEKTFIGPLARSAQIPFLESQTKDALEKGAQLLLGGKKLNRPGNYFEPTVFTSTNHSMSLMKTETFGPLIGIQKVRNDEEAIRLMNDTDYGLTAGVYTPDQDRATRILAAMRTGSVYWNCCDRVSPRLPWSGRGHSGLGCTLSIYGIQSMLHLKAWHLKLPMG